MREQNTKLEEANKTIYVLQSQLHMYEKGKRESKMIDNTTVESEKLDQSPNTSPVNAGGFTARTNNLEDLKNAIKNTQVAHVSKMSLLSRPGIVTLIEKIPEEHISSSAKKRRRSRQAVKVADPTRNESRP